MTSSSAMTSARTAGGISMITATDYLRRYAASGTARARASACDSRANIVRSA
jgi:hypothetical protein